MQVEKKHAFIMTNSGEFLKVKIDKHIPNVGQVYAGELVSATPFFKYAAAAASLLFVLLSGTASYAYYTPTASVVVDINPSIELKINRWDRILKTIPLNSDGEKVLSTLNIKNKVLSDGLDLIVEEAKKDNFINDNYIESGKAITVSVQDNKLNKEPNLARFEEYSKKNNLKVNIINKKEEQTPTKNSDNNKNSNNKGDKQQNNAEKKFKNNDKDDNDNSDNNIYTPNNSNKNNENSNTNNNDSSSTNKSQKEQNVNKANGSNQKSEDKNESSNKHKNNINQKKETGQNKK